MFNKNWFQKKQKILLWLLNTPFIEIWFRWMLRIYKYDCSQRITEITPNSFSWGDRYFKKNGKWYLERTTDFRTHNKYSKRLFYAFYPIWYLCHCWDLLVNFLRLPALNLGFDTLTVYPSAGAVSPVDGYVARENVANEDWNTIRNGAGTNAYPSDASGWITGLWSINGDVFTYLYRGYELVDTSAIPDDVTITAAEWNLYFVGHTTAMVINETLDLNVVSGIPTADNNLVASDFNISHFGTTVWGELSWNNGIDGQYNAIALNSAGLSNINKTGLSRFGFRLSGDVSGTAPTGASNTDAQHVYWDWYLADQTDTTQDPKLVVTYTIAVSSNFFAFFNQ